METLSGGITALLFWEGALSLEDQFCFAVSSKSVVVGLAVRAPWTKGVSAGCGRSGRRIRVRFNDEQPTQRKPPKSPKIETANKEVAVHLCFPQSASLLPNFEYIILKFFCFF